MSKNNLIYIVFFVLYLLFLYLVMPNGVDWHAYSSINIDFSRFYFYREPLGWFFISLFAGFDFGNLYIAFLISFLLYTSTIKLINDIGYISKLNCFLILNLLMFSNFYLLMSVNGLRQGLALSFFMFSFSFLVKKKYFYTFVFFLLSLMSHNSSIILMVVMYSYIFPRKFFTNLGLIFLIFSGPLLTHVAMKNSQESVTNNTISFFLVMFFIFSTSLLVHLLKLKWKMSHILYSIISLFTIGCAFLSINSAFERLVYYLIPLMIIFFSSYLNLVKDKLAILFLVFFLTVIFSVYSLTHPSVINNFENL